VPSLSSSVTGATIEASSGRAGSGSRSTQTLGGIGAGGLESVSQLASIAIASEQARILPMTETWKFIDGWSPYYEVSNLGRVRRDGRVREGAPRSHGYLSVGLSHPSLGKQTVNLHTLVATHFLGPVGPGMVVVHADRDRANNAADNLRIVTWREACRLSAPHKPKARGYRPGDGDLPPEASGVEWRELPGFGGRYYASSAGDIWTRFNRNGRGAMFSKDADRRIKYLNCVLRRPDGTQVTRTVHSIIAEAFLGPRPQGLYVCHRDDNPRNNAVANLYYAAPKQNTADAYRLGGIARGSKRSDSKLCEASVLAARDMYRSGAALADIADRFSVSGSTIFNAIRGKTWRHVSEPVGPSEARRR